VLFRSIGIIVQMVTLLILAFMYFKKPQEKMGSSISQISEKMELHKNENRLEIRQLRDAFMAIKQNDLHEMTLRQDQFANLLIEHTKELVKMNTTLDLIKAGFSYEMREKKDRA
jgi:hypothetical protein